VQTIRSANLAVRFALELCAVAACAYGGSLLAGGLLGWLLALAAAGAVIGAWALFVSPKAAIAVPRAVALAVEALVFAAAAVALAAGGRTALALAFAATALVSSTLNATADPRF
jgi:hypothetical protein